MTHPLTVESTLHEHAGRRVYFDPMTGNNGDDLIRMGCEAAMAKAGVLRTDTSEDAEVIVITGGGGMNDFSTVGLATLRRHLSESAHKPVIVLPQSYKFEHTDFGSLFEERTAPCTLFAREQISYDIIGEYDYPSEVRLGLDHDMALSLRNSLFLDELRGLAANDHVLIVERGDIEGNTGFSHHRMGIRPINRLIPRSIKMPIKRAIRRRQSRGAGAQTEFVRSMLSLARSRDPANETLPVIASDISDRGNATFEEFCELIARAAFVATNRLHVGILAAMLEKPTLVRPASYHKIRGIYEMSLSQVPSVELIQP